MFEKNKKVKWNIVEYVVRSQVRKIINGAEKDRFLVVYVYLGYRRRGEEYKGKYKKW